MSQNYNFRGRQNMTIIISGLKLSINFNCNVVKLHYINYPAVSSWEEASLSCKNGKAPITKACCAMSHDFELHVLLNPNKF